MSGAASVTASNSKLNNDTLSIDIGNVNGIGSLQVAVGAGHVANSLIDRCASMERRFINSGEW